jgi:hypothetical protein
LQIQRSKENCANVKIVNENGESSKIVSHGKEQKIS